MLNLNTPTSVETPAAAIVGAATDERPLEKNTVTNEISKVTDVGGLPLGRRDP